MASENTTPRSTTATRRINTLRSSKALPASGTVYIGRSRQARKAPWVHWWPTPLVRAINITLTMLRAIPVLFTVTFAGC